MKRSLVAVLGLLALAAALPASAADLPRAAVPYKAPAFVSAYNWTGFYLGVNGGYAWGNSDWDGLAVNNQPTGGLVGITAGYNWQGAGSPWVFGLEGDVDWAFIEGNATCGFGVTCQTKSNWFGTARGRVGYAFDRVMPYITGGLAVGDLEANLTPIGSVKDTNVGWTAGGGVEAAIAGNWTAKVEYLYADLGNNNCNTFVCGAGNNVDLQLSVVRGGINYRF
jgi:outer membrane immunogenic protein